MGDYLHLAWRPQTLGSAIAARTWKAAANAGFVCVEESETHWLGVCGPRAPAVRSRPNDPLILIGEIFDLAGLPGTPDQDAQVRYAILCRTSWGRYVAFSREAGGQVRSLFRDPSGAMEAFVWALDSLQVISSSTPDWLVQTANPQARVITARLATLIADPSASLGHSALDGVQACGAGDALDPARRESFAHWRPGEQSIFPGTLCEAAQELKRLVDRSVLRLSADVTSAVSELSGGLDSAIVGSSLIRGGARIRNWVNSYTDRQESDERAYAHLIAERLHANVTYQKRSAVTLNVGAFDETAGQPRPSLNGQDVGFDRIMADLCLEMGVEALFTGKGGDAVFMHAVDGAVFADFMKERGPAALFSPLLPALARWTRTSIWSIANTARQTHSVGAVTPARSGGVLPADSGPTEPSHPWLQNLPNFGPAKRRHVMSVVGNLGFQTRCRRNAVVDMIHPLTAQPIVEFCLSLPAWLLAAGGRDRGLARVAFSRRLPPAIVNRRSKGDYTAFFNQETADNLPFLRDYILGGRLSQLGVIDRSGLEAALKPDQLIWKGSPADLSRALLVEAWVRRWEHRATAS